MSEELPDILTYKPISEWTGEIVDFGMPTHDGNKRLTEIVTSASSASEATKMAFEVSQLSDTLAPAIEPAKLAIVRMFFGDQGEFGQLGLTTYEEALISHDIYTFSSVHVLDHLYSKHYTISMRKNLFLAFRDAFTLPVRKNVGHDYGWTTSYGNYAMDGNWDLQGMPYIQIGWHQFGTTHCSDPTYHTQIDCENSSSYGYCRDENGITPMCKRLDDGLGMREMNIGKHGNSYYPNVEICEFSPIHGGNTIGQCMWSHNNDDDASWNTYTSNDENWCMNSATATWPHLYWHWAAPNHTWTAIPNQWRPTTETNAAHRGYKIMTSDNHRHYPTIHREVPNNNWPHYNFKWDDNSGLGFGNGPEVGRSLHPWYITSEFEFASPEGTEIPIYGCQDQSMACSDTQWTTEELCINAGTCTDTTYDNEEVQCLAAGTCTNTTYDNDETSCLAEGTCEDQSYNNDEVACVAMGEIWTSAGNTYTNAGNTFTSSGDTWDLVYPTEPSCLTGGYTWDLVVGVTTIWDTYLHTPHVNPIYIGSGNAALTGGGTEGLGSGFFVQGFYNHTFVDSSNSQVQSMYGYTSHADKSQIRWRPPQYGNGVYDRSYPPPNFYRIYRSPYWNYGLTLTGSDYEMGIWKLVGEVPHTNDTGYHYFEEPRLALQSVGLQPFQSCGYVVTAVWTDWNWKRGLSYTRHSAYPYQWDPVLDSGWPNFTPGNIHWPTSGQMGGANVTAEHFAVHIDDEGQNYLLHRHRGYFRAGASGVYAFHIRADDSHYVWMGGEDQSISTLEGNITGSNYLVAAPGLHGDQTATGYTGHLTAGGIYPILSYNGNHGGGHTDWIEFTPPGGARTFNGGDYYYPDSGIGVVNPSANDGQAEVEGQWGQVVWSYYTVGP